MYEHHKTPLLSRRQFLGRVARHGGVSLLVIGSSLGVGTVGYHYLAELDWIDSLLNASMILTGMGPVDTMTTDSSKLFASVYALYSGIVFLAAVGVLFMPFFHRIMHKLHVDY